MNERYNEGIAICIPPSCILCTASYPVSLSIVNSYEDLYNIAI